MLALYHEKIKAAYSDYAFWDIVPLFEYFCLARILPYMTEESEKTCVLNGLQRVYVDLFGHDLPETSEVLDVHANPTDLSLPYDEEVDGKVTVIVPALGPAMEAPYPGGQVKLLTLNVSTTSTNGKNEQFPKS